MKKKYLFVGRDTAGIRSYRAYGNSFKELFDQLVDQGVMHYETLEDYVVDKYPELKKLVEKAETEESSVDALSEAVSARSVFLDEDDYENILRLDDGNAFYQEIYKYDGENGFYDVFSLS